ncbi:MAG: hypothetical protein AAF623_17130 [Planctomycetota bacterium]
MVVEKFLKYPEWIGSGLYLFLMVLLVAIAFGVFFGFLVASFRHGPFEAFYVVAQVIGQAIPDFIKTSPRRIFAIARLSIKEALRRKVVLVTFGIFATMLLFGGWFMNNGSEHPDQIYINFVLWGTQLLVLLMGMLISSFSLPEDIKNKTIYTIVTKPVRSTEIVFGRLVGFGILGTFLLALMGALSFFFVWRGLSHTHQIVGETQTLAAFEEIPEDRLSRETGKRVSENAIMEARTDDRTGHWHRLELIEDVREPGDEPAIMSNVVETESLEDGRTKYLRVICIPFGGHTHRVTVNGEGESATISLGPAVGYFQSRNPIYSTQLDFYDRAGKYKKQGINVGKEWGYRGYVDGGSITQRNSLSKAVFHFEDFREENFRNPEIMPLEMTLGVFRTYKGDIEKRVIGGIQFESVPETNLDEKIVSDIVDFETEEYAVQVLPISRKVFGKKFSADGKLIDAREYDLFDDIAGEDGKVNLILTCREYNQYLGVARADIYFRGVDDVYWWNFVKGYTGIWCQMMIIIAMGVAFSTFLSTPVTMLGSIALIIIGFFTQFIRNLYFGVVEGSEAYGVWEGGGPIESFIRVITQQNMILEFDTNIWTTFMEQTDKLLVQGLAAMTYLAPSFDTLDFSNFLTYGYSIANDRIFAAITIALTFCIGLMILGYFTLKTREIAK